MPIFAIANTGVVIDADWMQGLASVNSVGIAAGLIAGKPLGVTLLCFLAVASGICSLPTDLNWSHMIGAGILGGIGFTMSIFITNLAFSGNPETINASKLANSIGVAYGGSAGLSMVTAVELPCGAGQPLGI